MDTATTEEQASKVVLLIQETVQCLRSTKELAPGCSAPLDKVDLSVRFNELIPKVRQCCDVKGDSYITGSESQRVAVVMAVLWPLLTSLSQCYTVLDSLPPPLQKDEQTNPPPPPGLLSIQNYTDIAVFIEFLVCTSILPLLQQNVLPSAEDRARYRLPKSLAGRIPRRSLLWGCAVQNETIEMNAVDVILELRMTVATIGQVITLDRFRPMLLPRHVVDLYAAIFQADALEQQWKQHTKEAVDLAPENYKEILDMVLLGKSSKSVMVESITQARAYQSLLSRGRAAPVWLRQRVSTRLNDLACRDVSAIVSVFVSSAGDNMTSASLRLARALTSVAVPNDDEYYSALCLQLVSLLDAPDNYVVGASLDQASQADVLTVWAVLDQLPLELSLRHFFPLFSQGLIQMANDDKNVDTKSAHRAVRRIGMLLSSLPSSYNASKVSRLLLSPMQINPLVDDSNGAVVTILGQLLHLSTIETALVLNVRNDVVFTLQCAIETVARSSFPIDRTDGFAAGEEVAALALLYSVAPTILDINGYRYAYAEEVDNDSGVLESVTLVRRNDSPALDMAILAADLERTVTGVVDKVLLPLTQRDTQRAVDESKGDLSKKEPSRLPSTMFHLLLQCHMFTVSSQQSVSSEAAESQVELPSVFQGIHFYIQLAVMVLLPLVCEKFPPESLLLSDCDGVGILSMVKLILDHMRCVYGEEDTNTVEATTRVKETAVDASFSLSNALLVETLSPRDAGHSTHEDVFNFPMDETMTSTSSVVLTLLVTMLELGSRNRSVEEENILKSMMPTLGTIARCKERGTRADNESFLFQPQLAEMAAHAMVLIATRSQSSSHEEVDRPEQQSLMDSIREAELDLESNQPPIRARGIALLTKLSRRCLQEKEDRARGHALITVIDNDDSGEAESDDSLSSILTKIIRISVVALADEESYVYLAAIQSIVAAADASPREVIPMVGHAICSGKLSFGGDVESEKDEINLSTEQRVKLTEALLFIVRRRGKAIYEFIPLLMNLFLHGTLEGLDKDQASGIDAHTIQERTHRYFVEGNDASNRDDEFADLSREEMDIRLKTGGPIFRSEENDVLRAGCIAVLAELVSSTHPSVTARYCRLLMRFASNSLALEISRPVRRGTALLCYELYEATLREQDEETWKDVDHSFDLSSSLAVEMVSSGEETLHSALKRCIHTNDIDGSQVYDPAVVERCKEALEARAEVERSGILAAAKLHVAAIERENSSRVADLVRSRLNEKRKSGRDDVVTAMKGLKLDAESLSLQGSRGGGDRKSHLYY